MHIGLKPPRLLGGPLQTRAAGHALLLHPKGEADPRAVAFASGLAADTQHTLAVVDLPSGTVEAEWESVAKTLSGRTGSLRIVFARPTTARESRAMGQRLADRLDRTVVAPDGEVVPTVGGGLFIPSDRGTGWLAYRPGRGPQRDSQRFPKPPWEFSIFSRPWETSTDGTVEPLPSGVWVRGPGPGHTVRGRKWLMESLPCHPDILTVVLGTPGGPAVPLADVERFWGTVLPSVRSRVRFVHYGPLSTPEGRAYGQEIADRLGQQVVVYAGMPVEVRTSLEAPAVIALHAEGTAESRPFAGELMYFPRHGRGTRPSPPALFGVRRPLDGVPEISPGVYEYAADAVLEVVQSGLWLRPPTEPADADEVRCVPAGPGRLAILYDRSTPTTAARMKALAEDMLWKLDPATRVTFQVAPADDPWSTFGYADDGVWSVALATETAPATTPVSEAVTGRAGGRAEAALQPDAAPLAAPVAGQLPTSAGASGAAAQPAAAPGAGAAAAAAAGALPAAVAPVRQDAAASLDPEQRDMAAKLADARRSRARKGRTRGDAGQQAAPPRPETETAAAPTAATAHTPGPVRETDALAARAVPGGLASEGPEIRPVASEGPGASPAAGTAAAAAAAGPGVGAVASAGPVTSPPLAGPGAGSSPTAGAPPLPLPKAVPPPAPPLSLRTLAGGPAGPAGPHADRGPDQNQEPGPDRDQSQWPVQEQKPNQSQRPVQEQKPNKEQERSPERERTPEPPGAPSALPTPVPEAPTPVPQAPVPTPAPAPQAPAPEAAGPASAPAPTLTPAPTQAAEPGPAPGSVPARPAAPRIRLESGAPAPAPAPAPSSEPGANRAEPGPLPPSVTGPPAAPAAPAAAPAPAAAAQRSAVRVQPVPKAAACAAPGDREVGKERDWVRRTFSSQYNAVAGSVSRVMSESPGLRGASRADAAEALTDLVAVKLYLSGDSGQVDRAVRSATVGPHVPLARCVASGLRRLPSYRGPALLRTSATGAEREWFREGRLITEWGFCAARTDVEAAGEGDTDFLVWSMTARRTALVDPARTDQIVFVPGTSFKVLRAAEGGGERPTVLLRELLPLEIGEDGSVDVARVPLDEIALAGLDQAAEVVEKIAKAAAKSGRAGGGSGDSSTGSVVAPAGSGWPPGLVSSRRDPVRKEPSGTKPGGGTARGSTAPGGKEQGGAQPGRDESGSSDWSVPDESSVPNEGAKS